MASKVGPGTMRNWPAFDPEKLKEGLALLIAKEMESKLAES